MKAKAGDWSAHIICSTTAARRLSRLWQGAMRNEMMKGEFTRLLYLFDRCFVFVILILWSPAKWQVSGREAVVEHITLAPKKPLSLSYTIPRLLLFQQR